MSDPAKDAALRAAEAWGGLPFNLEDGIDAAREMAVPIRKIHTMRKIGNNGYYGRVDYWIAKCFVCNVDWPCDTARLVYTTEELSDGE